MSSTGRRDALSIYTSVLQPVGRVSLTIVSQKAFFFFKILNKFKNYNRSSVYTTYTSDNNTLD